MFTLLKIGWFLYKCLVFMISYPSWFMSSSGSRSWSGSTSRAEIASRRRRVHHRRKSLPRHRQSRAFDSLRDCRPCAPPVAARVTIPEASSRGGGDRAFQRGYLLMPLCFPSALAVRVPTLEFRLSASCLCSSRVGKVFFAKAARSGSLDCAAPWNSATAFE